MRQVRKGAKMTQRELAEKLGVSVMTVRNYESGKSVPDVYTAYMIAELISSHCHNFYYVGVPDLFRVVEFPDLI